MTIKLTAPYSNDLIENVGERYLEHLGMKQINGSGEYQIRKEDFVFLRLALAERISLANPSYSVSDLENLREFYGNEACISTNVFELLVKLFNYARDLFLNPSLSIPSETREVEGDSKPLFAIFGDNDLKPYKVIKSEGFCKALETLRTLYNDLRLLSRFAVEGKKQSKQFKKTTKSCVGDSNGIDESGKLKVSAGYSLTCNTSYETGGYTRTCTIIKKTTPDIIEALSTTVVLSDRYLAYHYKVWAYKKKFYNYSNVCVCNGETTKTTHTVKIGSSGMDDGGTCEYYFDEETSRGDAIVDLSDKLNYGGGKATVIAIFTVEITTDTSCVTIDNFTKSSTPTHSLETKYYCCNLGSFQISENYTITVPEKPLKDFVDSIKSSPEEVLGLIDYPKISLPKTLVREYDDGSAYDGSAQNGIEYQIDVSGEPYVILDIDDFKYKTTNS